MDHKNMYAAGFFKDFYTNILKQCDVNEIKTFDSAETDYDRFKFVAELKCIKDKPIQLDNVLCKNIKIALQLKTQGNAAFQLNNWALALDTYNEALSMTPFENGIAKIIIFFFSKIYFYNFYFLDGTYL